MLDVCIIGAGPSGATAGIYLSRANINTTIIYKDKGALTKAEKIQNFYGQTDLISGVELFDKGMVQLKNLGANLVNDEVLGISYDGNFIISTKNNCFKAKTVIIATGNEKKTVDIKGVKEYDGKGVSYCAVCDGFFYKDKKVAVIGNSHFALHEANVLSPLAKEVYILTNGKDIDFNTNNISKNITINTKKIKEIKGSNVIEKILLQDEEILLDGIFIAVGSAGASAIAKHIGLMLDERNNIIVDKDMKTNIPGVFATGDATGGLLQISKAVSDGAIASTSVIKYLRGRL